MKTYLQEEFNALIEEIEAYREMGVSPAKTLANILNAVQVSVKKLKSHVEENGFSNVEDEIDFFKREKPRFVAEGIFALEQHGLEINRPIGDDLVLKSYFEFELKHIRRFFEQHRFLYQYYLLDGHELDTIYFIRGNEPPLITAGDLTEGDPLFSTTGDYLFARFTAYERMQEYLASLLYPSTQVPPLKRKVLPWPGDKSDLIELAYGLFCWLKSRGIDATIVEFIEWLEESFSTALPRHYRRFAEIKMRKVSSRTKFLDEMRAALLAYMEEGDV